MVWTVSLLLGSAFLLGIGSLFLWVDFRASFGPRYTYFARQLVVLALVSMELQLETFPNISKETVLYLNWWLHGLTILFLFNAANWMRQAPWIFGIKNWFSFLGFSLLAAILIFTPDYFEFNDQGQAMGGSLYMKTFLPYCLVYAGFFLAFLVWVVRHSKPTDRKQNWIHLLFALGLFFSGIVTATFVSDSKPTIDWTYRLIPLATLGFGAMCAQFFAAEFFKTFRERQELFDRLGVVSMDLNRLQPLGKLGENAAYISHEIKNYVGVLKANNLLLQSKMSSSSQSGEMERITRSTDKLEQFTRSILDYSQAHQAISLVQVELIGFLRELAGSLRKSSLLTVSVDGEGPCMIWGDRLRLEQLVNNLFKNSQEAGARHFRIRVAREARFWVLEFEDDGCGCSPAEMEQLAKPFFSTKRHQGGSGLGLALVASIVSSHGGNLSFEPSAQSQTGGGLRIRCRLPVMAGNEKNGKKIPTPV
jgi:signal transduction histidine kinase